VTSPDVGVTGPS